MREALGLLLVFIFTVGVLLLAIRGMRSNRGAAKRWAELRYYASPEKSVPWVAPLLGVFAVNNLIPPLPSGTAFSSGAILGLAGAMATKGKIRVLLDGLLSGVGILATAVSMVGFLGSSNKCAEVSLVLKLVVIGALIAAFVGGILLALFMRRRLAPIGMGLFGAIEILLFVAFPGGVTVLGNGPWALLVALFVAIVFGAAASLAPNAVIGLAALGAALGSVGVTTVAAAQCTNGGGGAEFPLLASFIAVYFLTRIVRSVSARN
ncbi:hypothetical protein KNN17_21050 [Arthrobacter bambusae]|uniref:hypothetical protein n=1 Tax=Arthrobacter bambusae TaxID=1338426 RepID=UPI001F505672|nr:hypothetical protein [Arthrobacter bambusae]MCI0144051.1 hypothetical protein [Arthrobacter bambusae]